MTLQKYLQLSSGLSAWTELPANTYTSPWQGPCNHPDWHGPPWFLLWLLEEDGGENGFYSTICLPENTYLFRGYQQHPSTSFFTYSPILNKMSKFLPIRWAKRASRFLAFTWFLMRWMIIYIFIAHLYFLFWELPICIISLTFYWIVCCAFYWFVWVWYIHPGHT